MKTGNRVPGPLQIVLVVAPRAGDGVGRARLSAARSRPARTCPSPPALPAPAARSGTCRETRSPDICGRRPPAHPARSDPGSAPCGIPRAPFPGSSSLPSLSLVQVKCGHLLALCVVHGQEATAVASCAMRATSSSGLSCKAVAKLAIAFAASPEPPVGKTRAHTRPPRRPCWWSRHRRRRVDRVRQIVPCCR